MEGLPDLLQNTAVQAAVVFVLTWLFKRLRWLSDGKESLWFVLGISLLFGAYDVATQGLSWPACGWDWADPLQCLACIDAWVQAVYGAAGKVVYAATAAYMLLRREVAGHALLGTRL